jgi:hypothetical protein
LFVKLLELSSSEIFHQIWFQEFSAYFVVMTNISTYLSLLPVLSSIAHSKRLTDMQVTSTEYDEHKGRIAIGRLHAGELKRGIEVKVRF